jgi:Ca-activated chloride channel homolog
MNLLLLQEANRTTAEVRLPLWGELSLADPYFLLLLPAALGVCLWGLLRRRRVAVRVPRLPAVRVPRSFAQRWGWLPPLMKFSALCLAVLALSRPLRGSIQLASQGEGVDIALMLDRSSSMEAVAREGAPRRFDVAKTVVGQFARRRMTDTEGVADNVALFTFAGFTDLLCPFTLDADALIGVLDQVDLARPEMDGTGIGVAIAKVVEVFAEVDAKSKVAILLTDGKESVGVILPIDAAQLAAERGVKVYTVFVGPRVAYGSTRREQQLQKGGIADLVRIAELTDAKFFHAEDGSELESVYGEIESLERRERKEERFAEHFDLYPRLLIPAALLYALAWLCLCTWARRLP